MNLYIIRHAQSIGNVCNSHYYTMPEWKIPLTDEGREQAKSVGRQLRNLDAPHIIFSPYLRAKETAEIIGKQSKWYLYYQESPLIREREWGVLRDEVEAFETREERNHLFDFYRRPQGGESFADVYQRAFIFLEYLKRAYKKEKNSNMIIVSHGEFIKVLLMIIDGNTVEEFDSLPNIKNCEVHERLI
jgi:broad specificity phosphatase PhoE